MGYEIEISSRYVSLNIYVYFHIKPFLIYQNDIKPASKQTQLIKASFAALKSLSIFHDCDGYMYTVQCIVVQQTWSNFAIFNKILIRSFWSHKISKNCNFFTEESYRELDVNILVLRQYRAVFDIKSVDYYRSTRTFTSKLKKTK